MSASLSLSLMRTLAIIVISFVKRLVILSSSMLLSGVQIGELPACTSRIKGLSFSNHILVQCRSDSVLVFHFDAPWFRDD